MNALFNKDVFPDNMEKYEDIQIMGVYSISENKICNKFSCAGVGGVTGDLICKNFRISGTAKVSGNIYCMESVRISGVMSSGEGIFSKELRVSGVAKAKGDAVGEDGIFVSGVLNSEGNVTSEKEIKVSGSIKAKGDVSAENIVFSGSFNVGGLVNGEKVEIKLHDNLECLKIGSVGGSEISVKLEKKDGSTGSSNSFVKALSECVENFFNPEKKAPMLETESVEGDVIELENTIANVVRGNDITIGDNCRIGRIEYTGKVTYSENAEIGEMVEI